VDSHVLRIGSVSRRLYSRWRLRFALIFGGAAWLVPARGQLKGMLAPGLPLLRQLRGDDKLGRGAAVKSRRSEELRARTATADRVVKSVCPYCAVGCAQNIYVTDGEIVQIEGDPDAPHSRGRLCPKGSAPRQLTTGSSRERHVLSRRPGGADWERLDLETAMDMIADRVVRARLPAWE